MKTGKIVLLLSSCSAAAVAFHILGLGRPDWAAVARAQPGCSLSDFRGSFSFVVHGTNPMGQPFGAIGTFTADGGGNLDGFRVSIDNGERSTADFTCTYSMSTGCTFHGPCIDDGEATSEVLIDVALADNRREAKLALSGIPAVAGGAVTNGEARKW